MEIINIVLYILIDTGKELIESGKDLIALK